MTLLRVPIIDIGPFLEGSGRGKAQVAAEVDRACRDIGFLVITGHAVDRGLCTRMFDVSTSFFDLPVEQKTRIKRWDDSIPRGYSGVGDEVIAYSLGQLTPGDLKESLSVGPQRVPDEPYYTGPQAASHFAPNFWPERPPELRRVWEEYYRAMEALSDVVTRIFARALDAPEDYFRDKIDRHTSCLRVINYPDQLEKPLPDQLRVGAHSDYGTFTIVRHEDDPRPGGLQVQNQNGNWVDVPEVPHSFVVNIGDMLMRWSNDRWLSTMHRVVNPPRTHARQSRRLSAVFFHQPNYDAVVHCLPHCSGPDRPPKYDPISWGEYLVRKFTSQTSAGKMSRAS